MPITILLAMQAAGMITDWYAVQQEKAMGSMGESLNKAAITSNIETERLKAEDDSLMAMQRLRQTIGSQIAIQAARGTSSGAGSALSIMEQSKSQFGQDEQARRMNLLAKENELRAAGVLSGLHELKSETDLGRKLSQDMFNNLPTDPDAIKKIGGNLKGEWFGG